MNGRVGPTERRWDHDRFDELQQRAWDLDAIAAAKERDARHDHRASAGADDRRLARSMRDEAAALLARYWVLDPRPRARAGRT